MVNKVQDRPTVMERDQKSVWNSLKTGRNRNQQLFSNLRTEYKAKENEVKTVKTSIYPYCLQHHSQQPRDGNKLNAVQLVTGYRKQGTHRHRDTSKMKPCGLWQIYMKIEKIILSELGPKQKDKHHMFLSTCKAEKKSQSRRVGQELTQIRGVKDKQNMVNEYKIVLHGNNEFQNSIVPCSQQCMVRV